MRASCLSNMSFKSVRRQSCMLPVATQSPRYFRRNTEGFPANQTFQTKHGGFSEVRRLRSAAGQPERCVGALSLQQVCPDILPDDAVHAEVVFCLHLPHARVHLRPEQLVRRRNRIRVIALVLHEQHRRTHVIAAHAAF